MYIHIYTYFYNSEYLQTYFLFLPLVLYIYYIYIYIIYIYTYIQVMYYFFQKSAFFTENILKSAKMLWQRVRGDVFL